MKLWPSILSQFLCLDDLFPVAVMEAKTNYQTASHGGQDGQLGTIQSIKQPRWPVPKPSVTLQGPDNFLRLWCSRRNTDRFTCRSLEEQALIEEESQNSSWCPSVLPVRLPYSHSSHLIRGATGCISYHLSIGTNTSIIPQLIQPQKAHPPMEEQTSSDAPPMAPTPKQSLRLKRHHPWPEPIGDTPLGGATPVAAMWGPPQPQEMQEIPPWFKSTKAQPCWCFPQGLWHSSGC